MKKIIAFIVLACIAIPGALLMSGIVSATNTVCIEKEVRTRTNDKSPQGGYEGWTDWSDWSDWPGAGKVEDDGRWRGPGAHGEGKVKEDGKTIYKWERQFRYVEVPCGTTTTTVPETTVPPTTVPETTVPETTVPDTTTPDTTVPETTVPDTTVAPTTTVAVTTPPVPTTTPPNESVCDAQPELCEPTSTNPDETCTGICDVPEVTTPAEKEDVVCYDDYGMPVPGEDPSCQPVTVTDDPPSEETPVTTPVTTTPDPAGQRLPNTGSNLTMRLIGAAMLLVSLGGFLVVRMDLAKRNVTMRQALFASNVVRAKSHKG